MSRDLPLSQRLRTARDTLQLTQHQAAAEVGVAPLTWLKWENGDREPGSSGTRGRVDALLLRAESAAARHSEIPPTWEVPPGECVPLHALSDHERRTYLRATADALADDVARAIRDAIAPRLHEILAYSAGVIPTARGPSPRGE